MQPEDLCEGLSPWEEDFSLDDENPRLPTLKPDQKVLLEYVRSMKDAQIVKLLESACTGSENLEKLHQKLRKLFGGKSKKNQETKQFQLLKQTSSTKLRVRLLEALDHDKLFDLVLQANKNDVHYFGFELLSMLDEGRINQIVSRMQQKDELQQEPISTLFEEFQAWKTIY